MKDIKDSISKMLIKKALGYTVKEKIDEFVLGEDDTPKLVKRKVSTKHVAPDISAAKTLLSLHEGQEDIYSLTDEQLESEKSRLLTLLNQNSTENQNSFCPSAGRSSFEESD